MNIFYTMDSRLRGNDSDGRGNDSDGRVNDSGGTMGMTVVEQTRIAEVGHMK